MAFNVDPASLIGNALADVVQRSIIVGMPSDIAPVPNFVLCEIPEEGARTSVQLSALQIAAGDISAKSAINPGEYHMQVVLSDDDTTPASWFAAVVTALTAVANLVNQISSAGSVIPNLSALTTSYVGAQLASLTAMKNGRQPITVLQSYINLGTISQTSPYLASNWYIESISLVASEAEQGCIVDLTLKEQLTKRDAGFGFASLLKNLAGELVSPLAGAALGAVI